jgi:hypothetical protein
MKWPDPLDKQHDVDYRPTLSCVWDVVEGIDDLIEDLRRAMAI